MTEAAINSTVGVNLSPEGMINSAKAIERAVDGVITKLNVAAGAAKQAVAQVSEAEQKALIAFNAQMKQLGVALGQTKTLMSALTSGSASGNIKAAGVLGDFGSIQNLGKQARALAEYRSGLESTGSSMNALRGRLRDLNVEQGRMLQQGVVPNNNFLMNAEKIETTSRAYSKLTNSVGDLRGRIALLGEDSKKAFQPMLQSLDALDKKNAVKFRNKNLTNFEGETASYQKGVIALKEQVVLRERLEAKTRLNIDALREEATQLIRTTQLEREANLAAQVRRGDTRLNNLGITGGKLYQRDTDLNSRSERLARAAAVTQNQLFAATGPNVAAERLQTLILRYKELQRQIGETIALQTRQANAPQAKTGGFVGGFKASVSNLVKGGADAEGGGAYGAGALVGRVGAYAVAAAGVYALVTAMKSGIEFTIKYEDALAQLQAISGSTGLEMKSLSGYILEVAKNSANSVLEITQSATAIAQAGYAGKEIQTLLSNSVKLSAASGASPTESVDILTSALGAFQLAAGESGNVVDTLVATLNRSKLAVGQVQLGLQYMGATAQQNNITFGELTAAIGTMADAGIRSGSTAATGMRQMLVDFLDPSKKLLAELEKVGLTTADIDVKTLGLMEVMTRLRDSGFEAYGAIETRGAAAYAVMSSNLDNFQRLQDAGAQQGVADVAAAARLDSLSAKWNMLISRLSELGILLGTVIIPLLKFLVDVFSGVITVVNAVLAPILALNSYLDSLENSLVALDFGTFNELLSKASEGFNLAGGEAKGMAESIDIANFSLEELQTKSNEAAAAMSSAQETEASLSAETEKLMLRAEDLAGKNGNLTETTAEVSTQISALAARFPGLREEFNKTEGGIMGLISAMTALDNKAMGSILLQARLTRDTANAAKRKANQGYVENLSNFEGAARTERRYGGGTGLDSKSTRDFTALLRTGRQQEAFQLYDTFDARTKRALAPTYTRAVATANEYANESIRESEANRTIQQGTYALSEEGRGVRVMGRRNRAAGQRAGSQGSYMGRNRSQVLASGYSDREMLTALRDKYTRDGNSGAADIVGAALIATNQGNVAATPDPAKPAKKGAKGRTPRKNNTAANQSARVEASISKEELAYKKETYDNMVKAIAEAPKLEELPDLMDKIDTSLTEWLAAESNQAVMDILKNHPNAEQKGRMLAAAGRKAEELRISSVNAVGDALGKSIVALLDKTSKNIEQQYTEAMSFVERNVAITTARVQGLNNPLYQSEIPSYFKTVKQREADVATDRRNRAEIPANERRLTDYATAAATAREQKAVIEQRLRNLGKPNLGGTSGLNGEPITVTASRTKNLADLVEVETALKNLGVLTTDLTLKNDALRASYDVLAETPKTFSEGLSLAMQAVQINVGAASSLSQELINNLDKPLTAIHEGFKGFFSDVITGTASIGDAFKRMSATIIDSILQMVAVALANQFFKIIGSVLGTALGGIAPGGLAGTGSATGLGTIAKGFKWNGGEIPGIMKGHQVKGYINGGMINRGVPTRDSTLIQAAKGEYMIRRPAAQSLGKGFLDAINARGSHALRGMAPVVMPQSGGQPVHTNVYVIAPEEKPQLGASDVIAIISNDVLKGGATKKLIKQVSSYG